MRTLAFDGRMGASGDMLLATLLAAGADPDALAPVEAALEVRYEITRVDEHGIAATSARVLFEDAGDTGGSDGDHGSDSHTHGTHSHSHGHGHAHDHDGATPAEGHGPHRTYAEVVGIVESMDLPPDVESDALATFRWLGEAEAAVHDTDLESTTFHEVGADDAIADIVGVALLLADLGVARVVTTALATGGGTAGMAHGEYPVPAPAGGERAGDADWSLRGGPV